MFNLELREGLDSAFETGRDHDELDPWFHHLMILSRDSGKAVGTYRLQTSEMAAKGRGWYSAGSTISRGFRPASWKTRSSGKGLCREGARNGRVLNLLWRGLAQYLTHTAKRYLFGCCSLTSQEPALGMATLRYLKQRKLLHPEFSAAPLPELNCESLADPGLVACQQVHIPRCSRAISTSAPRCAAVPRLTACSRRSTSS